MIKLRIEEERDHYAQNQILIQGSSWNQNKTPKEYSNTEKQELTSSTMLDRLHKRDRGPESRGFFVPLGSERQKTDFDFDLDELLTSSSSDDSTTTAFLFAIAADESRGKGASGQRFRVDYVDSEASRSHSQIEREMAGNREESASERTERWLSVWAQRETSWNSCDTDRWIIPMVLIAPHADGLPGLGSTLWIIDLVCTGVHTPICLPLNSKGI